MVRKCSETVVGLEILEGLSTGLRCSLKRSLSRRLVSPMYCLEHWLHCIIQIVLFLLGMGNHSELGQALGQETTSGKK